MSGRQTYSQGRPTASAGALAGLLVMASMATACGSPYGAASPQAGDPARSVAQQDGYTLTLVLVPWSELSATLPPPGALRNLGYRLEVSGPGAVRVDMELFLLRLKGCAWSHTT